MKNKRIHNISLVAVVASIMATLLLTSCWNKNKETHIEVQPQQLYGLWFSESTVTHGYWRYNEDGTGTAWDEDEDVHEDDANTKFTWEVDVDQLTHIFSGEEGNQAVPKIYTITAIDSKSMQWKDTYGNTKNFVKQ